MSLTGKDACIAAASGGIHFFGSGATLGVQRCARFAML
jgi:hypothetical protein